MLCTKCKKVKARDGGKRCQGCLDYMRKYKSEQRKAVKPISTCVRTDCTNPATPGRRSCSPCREREERRDKSPEGREKRRLRNRSMKLQAFSAYGGPTCACCGESNHEFLSIDHIDGNGSQHRREINNENLYYWLKRNGYPAGFRVLCMNCNFALGHFGYCPHGLTVTRAVG